MKITFFKNLFEVYQGKPRISGIYIKEEGELAD